ncbi:MAG: S8 family serine peptidase [Methylococcaceae bacterium]
MMTICTTKSSYRHNRLLVLLKFLLLVYLTPALAINLTFMKQVRSPASEILKGSDKLKRVGNKTVEKTVRPIKLRSGTIIPGKTDDKKRQQALTQLVENSANEGGRLHVIIQFDSIPTEEDKARLKKQGIELLSYVPDYAWIASISTQNMQEVSALSELSWMGPLLLADKVSSDILAEKFSSWNFDKDNNRVAVIIHLHKDVELAYGHTLVTNFGGEVQSETHSIHALTAHVPKAALQDLAQNQIVAFVETVMPALESKNEGFQPAQNVDVLQPNPYGSSAAYNLNGAGIDVLVYDSGQVDDHIDFGTRLTHGDTDTVSNHSTHVAGTLAGDGANSASEGGSALQWHGVAPGADIISYGTGWSGASTIFYTDIGDIESDWDDAKNIHGADLGTASLGSNVAANGYDCDLEGQYGAASELMDAIVRGSLGEPYIATWAAGNERNTGICGTGYSTVAPPSCAKNPIHVGASNSNDDSMTGFSSWGPCDDGRLKPLVTAAGCQVGGDGGIMSTDGGVPDTHTTHTHQQNGYYVSCGTSMATPGVAGIVTLMLEQYRDTYSTSDEFLPSTAKAILMNTSVDAGNTGPDFQFGFGLVDAQAAVDTIIEGRFREATLESNGEENQYAVRVLGGTPRLQVSLAWDDTEASSYSVNALVNDINLELISPAGIVFQPWVLDPANPGNDAIQATDNVNNQEQVTVTNPEIGIWRVRVVGNLLPTAPQQYSLAATQQMISLDILNPTAGSNANVGAYDAPEALLIRLAILDDHGGPLTAPVAITDLDIEVGGFAVNNILLASSVGNEFWVLAIPPTQSAEGCYDLDVSLYSVLSDTENNSVCYSAAAVEDILLTLDISGSMLSDEKLKAAKDASQFFITLADLDDKIGVVSFATESDPLRTQLVYPLTTINSDAVKNAASLAVEGFSASGATALGKGMEIANNEMITNGDSSHEKTIVLLSDGRQNQATTWASIEPLIPASTTIHTVGLGPEGDPDDVLLSQIADDHQGDFWRVYTGSTSTDNVSLATDTTNVLADVYRRVAEETLGWQRIWETSGRGLSFTTAKQLSQVALSETAFQVPWQMPSLAPIAPKFVMNPISPKRNSVAIEPNLNQVVFAAHWTGGQNVNGILTLYRPDGSKVGHTDPDVAGHRVYGTSSGHEQYIIQNPQPGNWRIGIHSLYGENAEYIVMVEAKSEAKLLLLSPTALSAGACSQISVRAALVDHGPILNASLTTAITNTDGSKKNLILYDDGKHDDGEADDGLYGVVYNPCLTLTTGLGIVDQPRAFQIKVTAAGVSNLGQQVERTATKSFVTAPLRFFKFQKPLEFELIPFEPIFNNPVVIGPVQKAPVIIDPVIRAPIKVKPVNQVKTNPYFAKPGIFNIGFFK